MIEDRTAFARKAAQTLGRLDEPIGIECFEQALRARATDVYLNVPIADGIFDTKIDGWIHAVNMTSGFLVRYLEDPARGLDIARLTTWNAPSVATRFGHWQVDFHWKIDTRLWQYILYCKFFRRAYEVVLGREESLDEEEREFLIEAVREFFDEVEVTYCYRSEVIERARGFAVHPDPHAGSRDHAYKYTPVLPTPNLRFSELTLELTGPELGAGTVPVDQRREPDTFPPLDSIDLSGLDKAVRMWLEAAHEAKIADRWLRVRLGDRWVPTRLSGWEAGLELTLKAMEASAAGAAGPSRTDILPGLDLSAPGVAFGAAQAVYFEWLEGEPEQFVDLLMAQKAALYLAAEERLHASTEDVDAFVSGALTALKVVSSLEDLDLRELERQVPGYRPLHPRFAPVDPLEPLPWETRDMARHRRRMNRLGYTV